MPSYARKHQLEKSLVYHVYNRSHRGAHIFEKKEDFEHFADLLYRIKENLAIKIYHWVIMSNHYHLCLELDDPAVISGRISGLQRAYTHYYNRTRDVRGYLWQGRFKSQAIEGEKYLMACGRYIERNPVRARMVNEALEYPYSSAKFYCLGSEDGITDTDLYYDEFGDNIKNKQQNYRMYLRSFDNEEEGLFRELTRPLGSQAFKARLLKMGYHYFPRRRGLDWYTQKAGETGNPWWAIPAAVASLWTPETYQTTAWILIGAYGVRNAGIEWSLKDGSPARTILDYGNLLRVEKHMIGKGSSRASKWHVDALDGLIKHWPWGI